MLDASRRRSLVSIVIAIVVLGFAGFVRSFGLETNPPGLWQDEASTGLDAYLIWTTGKDRTGAFYPIIAQSFGDFPLAGYRYLVAPIVGLFGLTPGNERLVAAIFGTWLVGVAGWIAYQRAGRITALAAMVTAALCPTWIHFSRYGSEAILLPAALATGWALIDAGRDPKRRALIWIGAAFLAGAGYTYHAVKLFLPLWMIGFLIFQRKLLVELWQTNRRRHIFGPALIFTALILPSVYTAFTDGGMARGKAALAWYHFQGFDIVRMVLSHYLTYFDPGMLFVRGGPAAAQSIPGLGMWSFFELPLIITAFIKICRSPDDRGYAGFLVFWFLLGPLPGGVTYETHNMGRAIAWLPAPQLLSAMGAAIWIEALKNRFTIPTVPSRGLAISVAGAMATAIFLTAYAVVDHTLIKYPVLTKRDWQYEISAALQCAKRHRTKERIIVSPAFQLAPIFAQFHYVELDRTEHKRIWALGDRQTVAQSELYAFPANRPIPKSGRSLCEIKYHPQARPIAFVYGPALPPMEALEKEAAKRRAMPELRVDPARVETAPKTKP